MNKFYYIVFGGSSDQLFLIKNLKKLKYKIILFDKKNNPPGYSYADIFFNIDFAKINLVIKKLNELKKKSISFLGIISMGIDVPVEIATIANIFKLIGNPISSAKISKDKYLMKIFFKKYDIPSTKYKLIEFKK